MSFAEYLVESTDATEVELDEFVDKIKKNGLYGYDVFKHIKEDELRKILEDDEYFDSRMKKSDDSNKGDKDLKEMVIRPGSKDDEEEKEKEKEAPKENKLSLAMRLGLKKEDPEDDRQKTNNMSASNVLSNKAKQEDEESKEKETPQSFADRMRADIERRRAEREERIAKEKEVRDARAEEAKKESENRLAPASFNGKDISNQEEKDDKTEDKRNDDLDKELTNHMFKRTRTSTTSDEEGYKKVRNIGNLGDVKASKDLQRDMDKKFPKAEQEKDKVEDKEYQKDGHVTKPVRKKTNTEYSKRTLLAIADRMDFTVFCKFRKLDGSVRTGNFQIGKTESQVTQKQNTIIVQDLDLSKQENKVVWRTINLDKIIQIVPT